jgi:hypothetical protein
MKEQRVRVVISKEGHKKTLMKLERRKFSEFHSYCRVNSHVSYHTSGRSHIELGKWNGPESKTYYKNIVFNKSPKFIESVKILHALLTCYPQSPLKTGGLFPDYSKAATSKEKVRLIDESLAEPGDLLLIVSGIYSDENEIEKLRIKFLESSLLKILFLEKQLSQTDPHIFILVIKATHDQLTAIRQMDECLGGLGFAAHPKDGSWLSENGDKPKTFINIILDQPIEMEKLYQTPPEFRFHPSLDDPIHYITIESTPYQSKWVEVGKIAMKSFHLPRSDIAVILVTETSQLDGSWSVTFSDFQFLTSLKFSAIDFQITYGGHLIKQLEIAGSLYQFEYESFGCQKLDSHKHLWASTHVNQWGKISKHTLFLKVTEIQYKPEPNLPPQ